MATKMRQTVACRHSVRHPHECKDCESEVCRAWARHLESRAYTESESALAFESFADGYQARAEEKAAVTRD